MFLQPSSFVIDVDHGIEDPQMKRFRHERMGMFNLL